MEDDTRLVRIFDFTGFMLTGMVITPGLPVVAFRDHTFYVEVLDDAEVDEDFETIVTLKFLCGHCEEDHHLSFAWDGRSLFLLNNDVLADADGNFLPVGAMGTGLGD